MEESRLREISKIIEEIRDKENWTNEDLNQLDNIIEEIRRALNDLRQKRTKIGTQRYKKKEGELQLLAKDVRVLYRSIKRKLNPEEIWYESEEDLLTYVTTNGIDKQLLVLLRGKGIPGHFQQYLRSFSPEDLSEIYLPGEGGSEALEETEELRLKYLILASIHHRVNEDILPISKGIESNEETEQFTRLLTKVWRHVVRAYCEDQKIIGQILIDVVDHERTIKQVNAIVQEYGQRSESKNVTPLTSGEQKDVTCEAYIKKAKHVWEFGFAGKRVSVNAKLKGLVLIEFLILHKHEEYTPQELLRDSGLKPDQTVTSKEAWHLLDGRSLEEIKASIKKLEDDLTDAEDAHEKDKIEKTLNFMKEYISNSTNQRGKSRSFSEAPRQSVIRNINTVLNKISPDHKELYNHFDKFLRRGEICRYGPDSKIIWNIS